MIINIEKSWMLLVYDEKKELNQIACQNQFFFFLYNYYFLWLYFEKFNLKNKIIKINLWKLNEFDRKKKNY